MPDTMVMFEPLTPEEQTAGSAAKPSGDKTPIVPVPAHAPPMQFKHPVYGYPTAEYPYHLASGELAGFACRFEFVGDDGKPDKEVLPVTYCDLGNGKCGWRSKGIPAPRPLYRLLDLNARLEAPVLVCEGEKAANAGAQIFPDYVATTPMQGAKSPQTADWTRMTGRRVVIWPDHDPAGYDFAHKVAALVTKAGAAAVSIVQVPNDWPEKWDLADPVPDGNDPDTLQQLLAPALPWEPSRSKPEQQSQPEYHSFGSYSMSERGLYYRYSSKKEERPPIRLSDAFEVVALTRDPQSSGWGLLLRWIDADGCVHEWAMPWQTLGGGQNEIWRSLLDGGLSIASSGPERALLADYLSQVRPEQRACGLSRIGWHSLGGKWVYVLPDTTFGETGGQRVLWQTEARTETLFNASGTLEGWKAEIATKCVGNSRLVFVVSTAFAPPLLLIADEESGGFHLKGSSRFGKTVALLVAGSAWGGGSGLLGFARTWRATANGLEGIAEAHNDALLCLDEMGQVEARDAGEIAYMLSNGTGKGRAGRDGSPRRSAHWRLLFLSTGELSLAEKMAEIGRQPKAGQEVRLVEIPADAGVGLGMFENLHGAASGGEFAENLRGATRRQYGTPIRRFLQLLSERYGVDANELHQLIKTSRATFMAKHLPTAASGQVRSVCARFALVAAAGSLATAFGLTGWPDDEADRAAAVCFNAWLKKRGGKGDHEIESGIRQVIAFVEAHGSSRFEGAWDDDPQRVQNRVGFREFKDEQWHYYILPEMWKREVAKGHDAAALVKAMVARGLITPGTDNKPAMQKKIPHYGNKKVYALASNIIDSGEPEDGNAG